MLSTLFFPVVGIPKAQPRTKGYLRGVRVGIYTPGTANEWKKAVVTSALELADGSVFDDESPLEVVMTFRFPRPKSHSNKSGLKDKAPSEHISKPDLDNLAKSTLDALVDSGVIPDDCQVIRLDVKKEWALDYPAGADIHIIDTLNKEFTR